MTDPYDPQVLLGRADDMVKRLRRAARIQQLGHGLPETPAERLDLLYMVIEAEPALRQQITVQHKDLEDLDDADVTRFLNQLEELGALDHLMDEEDDEE